MPKSLTCRLEHIEREIQLLLLLQTAATRMPDSGTSSDTDLFPCCPAGCVAPPPPDGTRSKTENATSSGEDCPCQQPNGGQRHDFQKENVYVSVKTPSKKKRRAASASAQKTSVSCNIRRGSSRLLEPSARMQCQDDCHASCTEDDPQRDESCHPDCLADCTKMAAERDGVRGDRGSKLASLEKRCQQLEAKNAELHALLESNRAQVRESVQSKELALTMARHLKEKNEALRAEKELAERSTEQLQGELAKMKGEVSPSDTCDCGTDEKPGGMPSTKTGGQEDAQVNNVDLAVPANDAAFEANKDLYADCDCGESTFKPALKAEQPAVKDLYADCDCGESTSKPALKAEQLADKDLYADCDCGESTPKPALKAEQPADKDLYADCDCGESTPKPALKAEQPADKDLYADCDCGTSTSKPALGDITQLAELLRAAEERATTAELCARAAEERALAAEHRLDEMDETCRCYAEQCQDDEAEVTDSRMAEGAGEADGREEPLEYFDAQEQAAQNAAGNPEDAADDPELQAAELESPSKELQATASQSEAMKSLTKVLEDAKNQSQKLKSVSKELELTKLEAERLKVANEELEAAKSWSQVLEKEVEELKDENQQLYREASETAQDPNEKCCACAGDMNKLRSTVEELSRVLDKQEERIAELQEINAMQENLLLAQQQQLSSKDEQVRLANQEVDVVRQKSNELDQHVKRLRVSIESFDRLHTEGTQREDNEMKQARATINELKVEVNKLKKEVDACRREQEQNRGAPAPGVAYDSDDECMCDKGHCSCGDDGNDANNHPSGLKNGADDANDDFGKFQRDAKQAKQEVDLVRKRSADLGGEVLQRSVQSIERLVNELQQEQQRSAEQLEAVTTQYRASLEQEKDKVLIKDKIVDDQAASIAQFKEQLKRLERDLQNSNQRAAQLLAQLKEAQRREKDLNSQLRHASQPAESSCGCNPCHAQLDAQDQALEQLEVQVQVRQREWEYRMQAMQKEKEAAIAAARFATVKLVDATNEFRRQLATHKEVQRMLASVLEEREGVANDMPPNCICSSHELPSPAKEIEATGSTSWTSQSHVIYQRSVSSKSPNRSNCYE